MGGRHLLALKELEESGLCDLELVAVCDRRRDSAEHLADEAQDLLGRRPLVFEDITEIVATLPELQAVDITTDVGSHHTVACAAFDLGLHVLCEKPLALTVRGCNLIIEAQKRSGNVLSVAENYRRDPMARLTKALLSVGVVGRPFVLFDISAGAGNQIVILPWRHDKNVGGILLDGGVHSADVMQYYVGNAHRVYAEARLWEPIRYKPASRSNLSAFYQYWYDEMPDSIQASAEDTLVSVIGFENGVIGQWTSFYAAHGRGLGMGVVYGSEGSIRVGGIRNGVPPTLQLDGEGEVKGEALLELVPDFFLDAATTRLFGGDRLCSYSMTFPEADRKLLAIEYHEFGQCILTGRTPEVDGIVGRKAVALCYAAFESSVIDRPVTLDEIESERVGIYEAEINAHCRI